MQCINDISDIMHGLPLHMPICTVCACTLTTSLLQQNHVNCFLHMYGICLSTMFGRTILHTSLYGQEAFSGRNSSLMTVLSVLASVPPRYDQI